MTGQHADTNGLFACGLRLPDANKAKPGRMPGRNALGTSTARAQSRWTTVRIVNVRWEMASMSWLDGMEGDDPAYPGPAADPWAVPGFMPGISRGILVKPWIHGHDVLAQAAALT